MFVNNQMVISAFVVVQIINTVRIRQVVKFFKIVQEMNNKLESFTTCTLSSGIFE